MRDCLYKYWYLLCIPLYFLWMPIFAWFFAGGPSIFVWILLLYMLICAGLQSYNIIRAYKKGEKTLAIKMFLLFLIGILVATSPIFSNFDYSIKYMLYHNIFTSYP